jgi:hypothetical protein
MEIRGISFALFSVQPRTFLGPERLLWNTTALGTTKNSHNDPGMQNHQILRVAEYGSLEVLCHPSLDVA